METLVEALTTLYKGEMMHYLRTHPEKLNELIKLSISYKERHSARAAWLLSNNVDKAYNRLHAFADEMLAIFPELKDGHKRDFVNTLSKIRLNEDQEGILLEHCIDTWGTIGSIPSVRYVAMLFILKMTRKYPELKNEVEILSQEPYLESLSPGIQRSLKRRLVMALK